MTSGFRPPRTGETSSPPGGRAARADSRFATDDTGFGLSAFFDTALPADAPASRAVVALDHWPQMRRVPADRRVDMARICALLAHSPSASFLIHRRLDLPVETVRALLRDLHGHGCLRMAGPAGTSAAAAGSDHHEEPARAPSLWNKLLKRLRS